MFSSGKICYHHQIAKVRYLRLYLLLFVNIIDESVYITNVLLCLYLGSTIGRGHSIPVCIFR